MVPDPQADSVERMALPVVVAEIVRSGFVEGHHYGSWVAIDAKGSVLSAAGDVERPMLPRSCNKPIQALAMVEAGLPLEGELLALACASHSGEGFHVEGVRRILASVGLDEDTLQTPPDWPLDDETREELIRSGGSKASVLMNCSGKHAAMLATCVLSGWPITSYLEVDHPLQQAILATFQRMTGEPAQVAVDGCGAPLLSTSLAGLARAFSRLALGSGGFETPRSSAPQPKGFETGAGAPSSTTGRVAEAIRAHPEFVSGTRRDELALLLAMPGAIGKAGAESCYVVALPDGRAFATKTDDGAARARPVVMAALLERLGVTEEPGVDGDAVRRTGESVLLGGGKPVGEIRAVVPD
jgi:L-asparaginase II